MQIKEAGVAGAQPMPVLSPVEGRGGFWGVSPQISLFRPVRSSATAMRSTLYGGPNTLCGEASPSQE